jgi:mono/diheme cytochrome c family protein
MRRVVHGVLLALAVLVAGGCAQPLAEDATGDEVYRAACAACHGSGFGGQATVPGLGPGSPSSQQPRSYLVDTVTLGRGRMPSFQRTLTPDQIDAVVDYLMVVQER